MYIFNMATAVSIRFQCWCLLLMVNVQIAHAQNNFNHFRMVVTCAKVGLLVIATFLESSNMPTADSIRGETVIVMKGDDLLSRFHA